MNFKNFQIEDYARAALVDGIVLGHATGCGKSLAGVAWPLLKVGFNQRLEPQGRVLLIAPENLHAQLQAEAERHFRVRYTKLDCQQTYHNLTFKNGLHLPNGFYITSYTQLATNKVLDVPEFNAEGPLQELMDKYGVKLSDPAMASVVRRGSIVPIRDSIVANLTEDGIRDQCRLRYEQMIDSIGKEVGGIRCCYSPSLAELCRNEFDCVVLDEGTRIKSDDAEMAKGVRLMNPKYRMLMTATPIKNRLPDLFFLLWWVAGAKPGPHARFPYGPDDRNKFAAQYLTCEINLTKEREKHGGKIPDWAVYGGKRPRGKITAELCNAHRLWKFLGPLILRRRKEDTGEVIVKKFRHQVYVPMGQLQNQVYQTHLRHPYVDAEGKPAMMAKLQALRSAAAAPHSELLQVQLNNGKLYRSPSDFIPKYAAALHLIEQIILRGEQVVLFSSFHEPLNAIGRKLLQCQVPFFQLDGRQSAKKRGKMSLEFQKGLPYAPPIMLAGSKAMSEGNNWYLANNVIYLAYDWAWDVLAQGMDRVHRLNSVRDVNVWSIICERSVDRRLEALLDEKGNSSDLALDGKLNTERAKQVSLRDILEGAQKDYEQDNQTSSIQTISEVVIEQDWPALRERLRQAWLQVSSSLPRLSRLAESTALPILENRRVGARPDGTILRFGQTLGGFGFASDAAEAAVEAVEVSQKAEANKVNRSQNNNQNLQRRRRMGAAQLSESQFAALKNILESPMKDLDML